MTCIFFFKVEDDGGFTVQSELFVVFNLGFAGGLKNNKSRVLRSLRVRSRTNKHIRHESVPAKLLP